jgi:exportin-1
MERLLDFSPNAQFDVALMDQVVAIFYDGQHPLHAQAHGIVQKFREHPQAWQRVDGILERSQSGEVKFLALSILQLTVSQRWKALDEPTRKGIRNYMVSKILQTVKEVEGPQKGNRETQALLRKLNEGLVTVLKQEWPHNWPTFIDEMVSSGKSSEDICENNMKILGLLYEEIFQFSEEDMLSAKVANLKASLKGEFGKVFDLCKFALERSQRATLVSSTLSTTARFMSWIPQAYIFETPMLQLLVTRFLHLPQFRCDVLSVLTEVADFGPDVVKTPQYRQILCGEGGCFVAVMGKLNGMLPLQSVNIAHAFATSQTEEPRRFVLKLALFLKHFFANWLGDLEAMRNDTVIQAMLLGQNFLSHIARVDNDVTFKVCLEHWHDLAEDLYKSLNAFRAPAVLRLGTGLMSVGALAAQTGGGGGLTSAAAMASGGGAAGGAGASGGIVGLNSSGSGMSAGARSAEAGVKPEQRQQWYASVLHDVRDVMVSKMARPKEMKVAVNEDGQVVKPPEDTSARALYQTMRETLVFLTHLDYEDSESIMLEKLAAQVDSNPSTTQWSWEKLQTLCHSIGSISGAMNEDDEKRFLVTVIKDLLGLCENKRGKDNKAIVASCIMYVVGQYPRFLRAHWKFLKTVVNKNFEFMHELHHGVRDMACETFLKIAQKCKRKFVVLQTQERAPFIEELLMNLPATISDLEPHQVLIYYEAVGHMVQAQNEPAQCKALMTALMRQPNSRWAQIMQTAGRDVSALHQINTVKEVASIVRVNVSVAKSVGPKFLSQLGTVYMDMLQVYKTYSEFISQSIQRQGPQIMQQPHIRAMRTVKVEILTLISTFVEGRAGTGKKKKRRGGAGAGPAEHVRTIAQNFVPPLLVPVLADYQRGIPQARESHVLMLFTGIVSTCRETMTSSVPKVLDAVLGSTLEMIAKNFVDFPDHRIHFYNLLTAIVRHCFQSIFQIPPAAQVCSIVLLSVVCCECC